MEPKNYTELPQDEHGNRAYTNSQPLVIRALKLGTCLKVIAPGSFLMRWSTVKAAGWKEVDHEPGPVTVEEWKRLVGLLSNKAWFVINRQCDEGEVIHAPTRGKAIYKSEAYREGDFIDIRATRLPKMDGKPWTDENAYLAGLQVLCRGHCEQIAADWENGGDPFFDKKGRAFCSDCWEGSRDE